MIAYHDFVLRNAGYLSPEVQERIRRTRLLVAGCGIGSSFAEAALRLGFEHITLADGDTVSVHNLNRQNFTAADVGQPKVQALARRLRAINPAARITELNLFLTPENVGEPVAQADLVFDTIDFLDLSGIVALHDACRARQRPVITALSVGWGAGCVYFPAGSEWSFRRLFGLSETGSIAQASYVERFGRVLERLAARLDPTVVRVVQQALTFMEDGKPCPASQVAPGAFAVGALGATVAARVVAGLPVLAAPQFLLADLPTVLTTLGIDLAN